MGLPSREWVRIPLLRYSARAIQLRWNHVGSAPQIGPSDSEEPDTLLSELSPSFSECAAVDFTISASSCPCRLQGTILSTKKFNILLSSVDWRHSRRERTFRFQRRPLSPCLEAPTCNHERAEELTLYPAGETWEHRTRGRPLTRVEDWGRVTTRWDSTRLRLPMLPDPPRLQLDELTWSPDTMSAGQTNASSTPCVTFFVTLS